MRTHQATIVSAGGWTAEIDVELASLIAEVWRAGIETIHSCQDVGENIAGLARDLPHLEPVARREAGRASIGFADISALVAFHDALANSGRRDGFYERMLHWASPHAWQCVIGLRDLGLVGDEGSASEDSTSPSRVTAASFQVRFPRSDIDEVTERLRRHNRREDVVLGRPSWSAITVKEGGEDPPDQGPQEGVAVTPPPPAARAQGWAAGGSG